MRRPSLRRAVQLLAVGTVVGSASMLLLPGASAAGPTKVPLLQQAWFWQNAYEQASPPVAVAAPATEPDGVPDGDLAVAFTQPGATPAPSSKMTALSFDVGSLTAGSSVSDFTFSLTLDGSPSATSFNAAGATILACLPTRGWPATMKGDYTDEPTYDCTNGVAPEVKGSTYTFSIAAIAQSWVDDQNLGVAIVADPQKSAAPFQLVFKGGKNVEARMSATAPITSSGTGSTGSTSVPPATTGGSATGPSVVVPNDSTGVAVAPPPPAPAPVVAAQAPASPPTAPVAAVKPASAAPTGAFWAAAAVLGLLVLGASLVLGDGAPVVATASSGSRLERVLRQRESAAFTVRSL